MKTIILFLVILSVLLFESPGDSFGQWQPDVNILLSTDPGEDGSLYPCI